MGYSQSDFSGGLNLFDSDAKLADNEYCLASNIRIRTNDIVCAKDKEEDTTAPAGLKQGLYAFDNYLLLFCRGSAFYKDVALDTPWTQVNNFNMSTEATRIFTEAVPASTLNFERRLQEKNRADGSSSETNLDVNPLIRTGPSLSGLVCQDGGTTQPYIIYPNAQAAIIREYNAWTKDFREYVPRGRQMKYMNGILFVVSPDGKSLYRSVSGRPTDFVVNVNSTGDKGGNADTTSYAVGYNPITCLSALNSGELFVGTAESCHPVEFNYERTIFAEPTFLNRRTFSAGIVNQFSFIDILSDYTFIDIDGLRSFNAVLQQQSEGRNSIFSSRVSRAFAGIKQTDLTSAAIVFDNYSFFAVNTIYGYRIGIYDNNRLVWVSFDNLGLDQPIKQFAIAKQSTNPTLYGITSDKVYKLYSSETNLQGDITFKAATSGKAESRVKLQNVYVTYDGALATSDAEIDQIVGNAETVNSAVRGVKEGTDTLRFNFTSRGRRTWKVKPRLRFQSNASIPAISVLTEEITDLQQ